MGFVKSFAEVVTDVVNVELQVLPALIGGALTGGVGGAVLSGLLAGGSTVLSSINREDFEATGLTPDQQLVINEIRSRQGLPLVNKFGVEGSSEGFGAAREAGFQAIRREIQLLGRTRGLGSALPTARPELLEPFSPEVIEALRDRPVAPVTSPSNLSVRIPDKPATGGALRLEPPKPAQARSLGGRAPSTPGPASVSSGAGSFNGGQPMGSFFETLGDRLLASAPDIVAGFASGGFGGGLAAAGLASIGGLPSGGGGVPPRIAMQQQQTRAQVLTAGLQPLPPVAGTVPVGFASTLASRLSSAVPTPLSGRLLALGGVAAAVGAVSSREPGVQERFQNFLPPVARPGPLPPPTTNGAIRGILGAGMPMARGSNFAKDDCGNVLKFFCSPRPGEGWQLVSNAAAMGLKPRKPFARFNLLEQRFERMPRRRMNVANLKALGRAKRRQDDFIDLVLPMIRDRKKESAGKKPRIVARRRKRKAS